MNTKEPPEVVAISHLHSDLVVASHVAVDQALESIRPPGHEQLEHRYLATLGHNISWALHLEVHARAANRIRWIHDRGFLAMVPVGTDVGVAVRLGRCDDCGRPNHSGEREQDEEWGESTPFGRFQQGTPLLFENALLCPLFGGYSLRKDPVTRQVTMDQFIVAKFERGEHVWSWALEPVEIAKLPRVIEGREESLEIVPKQIPINTQKRFG